MGSNNDDREIKRSQIKRKQKPIALYSLKESLKASNHAAKPRTPLVSSGGPYSSSSGCSVSPRAAFALPFPHFNICFRYEKIKGAPLFLIRFHSVPAYYIGSRGCGGYARLLRACLPVPFLALLPPLPFHFSFTLQQKLPSQPCRKPNSARSCFPMPPAPRDKKAYRDNYSTNPCKSSINGFRCLVLFWRCLFYPIR